MRFSSCVLIVLSVVPVIASAKSMQMICGYPFYGPVIEVNEQGHVIKASFQDGYSSANLNCTSSKNLEINCSRPQTTSSTGYPLNGYEVSFNLGKKSADSVVTSPGSDGIKDHFENCQVY